MFLLHCSLIERFLINVGIHNVDLQKALNLSKIVVDMVYLHIGNWFGLGTILLLLGLGLGTTRFKTTWVI